MRRRERAVPRVSRASNSQDCIRYFSKAASKNFYRKILIYNKKANSNYNKIIFIWGAIVGGEERQERIALESWRRPAYHTPKDQNCFSLLQILFHDRRISYLPTCRRNIVKSRDAIYKDVYNATIRVQLEIRAHLLCNWVTHIHILINNWSKE